ncbi:uncharacterized protein [Diabrotica undecimpunctata]|uniref:uncharacterized protein n=1 Tax=Diabrotica undecimpunctata TaxID=50387 RepID=UPI003B6342CC
MATVPCQLVILTEDPVHFPIETAFLIIKELFVYGVKEVSLKGSKIFVSLSYTPNSKSLKKKFGNLPVRYMRTKVKTEQEFQILENVVKRYRFNLLDDELEEFERHQQVQKQLGLKRPLYIQEAPDEALASTSSKKQRTVPPSTIVHIEEECDENDLNIDHFLSQRT